PNNTTTHVMYTQNKNSGINPSDPYNAEYGSARDTYNPKPHLPISHNTAPTKLPITAGFTATFVFGISVYNTNSKIQLAPNAVNRPAKTNSDPTTGIGLAHSTICPATYKLTNNNSGPSVITVQYVTTRCKIDRPA